MPRSKLAIGTINAATPTPVLPSGELDRASMPRLAQRWINVGVDGVLLLGSMGEGLWLSDQARNQFVEDALTYAGDKLVLFASAADHSAVRMKERALRYARMGAHCVVLCIRPGAAPGKGVEEIKDIAEACPVPCAYYENPVNTGTSLLASDLLEIIRHENMVALKDSSGNHLIAQILTAPEYRVPGVKLLHGPEYCVAHSALLGYDGVLHGGGVLTARRVRRIWDLVQQGDIAQAVALDRENSLCLGRIYNRLGRPLQNVSGQKHALKLLGVLQSDALVTDGALDDAARARIAKVVDEHRQWLEEPAVVGR